MPINSPVLFPVEATTINRDCSALILTLGIAQDYIIIYSREEKDIHFKPTSLEIPVSIPKRLFLVLLFRVLFCCCCFCGWGWGATYVVICFPISLLLCSVQTKISDPDGWRRWERLASPTVSTLTWLYFNFPSSGLQTQCWIGGCFICYSIYNSRLKAETEIAKSQPYRFHKISLAVNSQPFGG